MTVALELLKMNERQDATLLARGRAGDPEALNDLVRLYWRAAYQQALRILRRHEDAEDVAQDALLSAIVHLGAFDERASFGTWLHRIVFNHSIMLLRHKRSSALDAACVLDEQMQGGVVHMQKSPESTTLEAERDRLLSAALRTLPGAYSIPLRLFTYQEESIDEIAQHLRLSPSGVKIRLHRGRKLLRQKTAHASRHTSARIASLA